MLVCMGKEEGTGKKSDCVTNFFYYLITYEIGKQMRNALSLMTLGQHFSDGSDFFFLQRESCKMM